MPLPSAELLPSAATFPEAASLSSLADGDYEHVAVRSLAPCALYWRLDDLFGAADLSGNGRGGTGAGSILLGAEDGPLAFERSVATGFDGIDDRIDSGYSPFTSGTARTFAGWARRANDAANHTLLGSSAAVGDWVRLMVASGTDDVKFLANATAATVTWSGTWPGSGRWAHWAVAIDVAADSVALYVDGALASSETLADDYGAAPGTLVVGARSTGQAPWNGQMACVAAYERALRPVEVLSLFKAGRAGAV